MNDQSEKKFYVYVHRYASGPKQGEIFYVGKGVRNRAWVTCKRSVYWDNIYKKYGREIDILKDKMPEHCSLTFEKIAIFILGKDNLSNMTIGGEGVAGFENFNTRKPIINNIGIRFPSILHASHWLKSIGIKSENSQTHISSCALGKRRTAFGYAWAFEGDGCPLYIPKSNYGNPSCHVPVFNNLGMRFESLSKAAAWVRSLGYKNACGPAISACARKETLSAYGHSWSYTEQEIYDYIPRYQRASASNSKEIFCSNGMKFENSVQAAKWLKEKCGFKSANRSSISQAATGARYSAYGFSWSFSPICDDEYIEPNKRKGLSKRKLLQCSNGMMFNGVEEAVSWLEQFSGKRVSRSSIEACATRRSKTSAGYGWSYVQA